MKLSTIYVFISLVLAVFCLANAEAGERLNVNGLVVFSATHCIDGDQYYIDARHTFKLKGTCGKVKRPKYHECKSGVAKRWDRKLRKMILVKNKDGSDYDCSSDKKKERD